MEKKNEQIHPDQWLKDLPVQSEEIGFKAEEMILCDKCQRKSPPTRLKCFYCGADLKVSYDQTQFLKPSFRKLEDWEKGFNLVYLPKDAPVDEVKAAKLLNLEREDATRLFSAKKVLPLARLESQTEAEVLVNRLHEIGIDCKIVLDELLKIETLPRRLRGIDFYEDKLILILFNADEVAEIPLNDINLIVVGTLFERKIEAVESMKKKDEKKVLESAEISSDETVIDIYSTQDNLGYRIEPKGFDFSCLGAEKSLLAKDNIKTLAEKLRSIVPNAKFDNDYLQIRLELSKVWEVSQRNDSNGLNRSMVGKLSRTNITTVSNLIQFTRYSRLLRNLL
ncbi:MAG: hypothetical protein K1X72_22510 [Pyrinomonadaceae bacterium]|nr:hypothetical protein [Pyrinomonadaceae bacterium]